MKLNHPQLVDLLQQAYSAEKAAAFACGANTRYIKHVKGRNDELPNGVYQVEIVSKAEGLVIEYSEMTPESEHFSQIVQATPPKIDEAKKLYGEGKTMEEIGVILKRNKGTISRWLSKS